MSPLDLTKITATGLAIPDWRQAMARYLREQSD